MGLFDGVLGQVLNSVGGGGAQPAQQGGFIPAGQFGQQGQFGQPAAAQNSGLASVLGGLLGGGGAGQGAPGAGGGGANHAALLMAGFALLQQMGGISGLMQRLQQSGLGAHASSWVGQGANAPVTGAQLTQALGPAQMQQFAAQAGVPPEQAGDHLAQLLPALVNHMTPQGAVPGNEHDMLSGALGALRGAFGG